MNPKKHAITNHLYPLSTLIAVRGSSQRVAGPVRGGKRAFTVTMLNERSPMLIKATVRTVHAKPILGIRRESIIGKTTPV
jgi:hypothetical protein